MSITLQRLQAILRQLHGYTGHGSLLFPVERSQERPIRDHTPRAALQTLGCGSDKQSAERVQKWADYLDELAGAEVLE